MKKINLTQGKYALVDEGDVEIISKYKWSYSKVGYAASWDIEKGKGIYMHRLINNTPHNMLTDHINGNKLDNRKENLRSVDKSQNGMNRTKQTNNSTGYKGVYISHNKLNPFRAQICINNKRIKLGYFRTAQEAYSAYIEASKSLHKEFSNV